MANLAQAVNIKLWSGNGEPAKAWGRLKHDPDLWDPTGDTVIFFSHTRTDPSFRTSSTLLRATASPLLKDMLLVGTVREGSSFPGVSYKLYMDAPSTLASKTDILRYHLATRNLLAFLLRRGLVGFTFYQALRDLQGRLEEILPVAEDAGVELKRYLVEEGYVDVSNDSRAAAGLLAWSEEVRWREGWREGFVHAVGMYDEVFNLQEFAEVSTQSRGHIERASSMVQIRTQEAEDALTDFCLDEAGGILESMPPAARRAADRFRKFLRRLYEGVYQRWPPKFRPNARSWLDREVTRRLQQDLAAVYEYLADRTMCWNMNGDGTLDKTMPLLQDSSQAHLSDAPDTRLANSLCTIDVRLSRLSVPRPFPLLPPSVAPAKPQTKFSIGGRGKKERALRESRIAHEYAMASNMCQWSSDYAENELARAFVVFEKSDGIDDVDPRDARRARWVILYCLLQTLADIANDVPDLQSRHHVRYFLNAPLTGLPPWEPGGNGFPEACRERSHCWTTVQQWGVAVNMKDPNLGAKPPPWDVKDDTRYREAKSNPQIPEKNNLSLDLRSRESIPELQGTPVDHSSSAQAEPQMLHNKSVKTASDLGL